MIVDDEHLGFPKSFWKLGSFKRKRTSRAMGRLCFGSQGERGWHLGGGAASAGVVGAGTWLAMWLGMDRVWKPNHQH